MKHKAKQRECNWGSPEAFTLVPESTLDGERIAKERAQQQQDREQAEQAQADLLPKP